MGIGRLPLCVWQFQRQLLFGFVGTLGRRPRKRGDAPRRDAFHLGEKPGEFYAADLVARISVLAWLMFQLGG